MQRKQLRDGLEVQVKTSQWSSTEAVIVFADYTTSSSAYRRAGRRSYGFSGAWNQIIAVAQKNDDGTWTPRFTTTRNVLDTVSDFKVKERAESIRLAEERKIREEWAEEKAAAAAVRRELNPAIVDALNEFVGSENAFRMDYNSRITVSDSVLVHALATALGLEVPA